MLQKRSTIFLSLNKLETSFFTSVGEELIDAYNSLTNSSVYFVQT